MRKKYQKIAKEICSEAIIFARVSSEKQEKGASIDAQKELIYDYCLKHKLNVIKELTITESTTRGDRKQYKEMLDFIRKKDHKIAIVVNCVDRLQRSDQDNPAIDELRRTGKIEVHFIKENIILHEDSSGNDLLFWKMNVLMANSYVISLASNVRRSMKYNFSLGKWQGFAPIGYLNSRDDNNDATLITDPVRAPIIKTLFQEYATGSHTTTSIWQLATKLGLCSKMKSRKGLPISKNTVYELLTNPFYYGIMCIKGEFIPHIYEPLISKELFDKVQLILTNNGNHNRTNVTEYAKTPYIFRGWIYCKECGCLITPETKIKKTGQRYIYLRCGHPNKVCHQKIVREDKIIDQLKREVLDKITLSPTLQTLLKQKLTKDLTDTSSLNATLKGNITRNLAELKVKEDKLLDFYLEGKLPQETYDLKKAAIDKEIEELETTAEKYQTISNETKKIVSNVISMAGNISNIFDKASITRKAELLKAFVYDCQLNGDRLEYKLKAPFDKLVACNNYKEWPDIAIKHIDEFDNKALCV